MKKRLRHMIFVIYTTILFTFLTSPICQAVVSEPLYVDKYAEGANNGSSWADAYTTIADALSAAASGKQIWVKADTYNESIALEDGVALYGGFAGTETELSQRDWVNNVTTIDGDGVDHVVIGADNATIDGFTITDGNGNGIESVGYCGGMLNEGVSPMVVNCTFKENSAYAGGGMYNYYSSPTVTNCTFTENSASYYGGGMYNQYYSSPTITNCIFTENSADTGGGMYNDNSSPTVTNCILWGDSATNDPEIYNDNSAPTFSYNDIEGCVGSGKEWDGTLGTDDGGNIDLDPKFVGSGDYHLQAGSPCIDAGTSDGAPTEDLEGNTRPQRSGYDMGAYEYENVAPVISLESVTQRTDGSGYLYVVFTGTDAEDDEVTWYTDYCSYTPDEVDYYDLIPFFVTTDPAHTAVEPMAFSSSGTTFTAVVNASTWASDYYKIRLRVEDYDLSNYPLSSKFEVDNTPPNAPVITTNEGNIYTTSTSSVTLTGSCTADTWAIYVNGSADGVTYTPGETTWSYTGALGPGLNTFEIEAVDLTGNISASDEIQVTFAPAAPGIYFVGIENGTDDLEHGTSSEAGAWKTLHYAINLINEGDPGNYTIHLALGTYSVENGEPDEYLTITQDNVTILGAGAGSTIIDGTNADSWVTGIEIAASNVTIKDLAVKGFSDSGIYISSGTGNIIEGCNVYDNSPYGILIEPYESTTSGNIIWNNCEIYHNEIAGIFISGSDGNEIYGNQASIYDNGLYGIYVVGADNNLIHDNNIYWSGDTDYPQVTGILIEDAGSGNQINRNEIHGHYDGGIWVVGSSPVIKQNEIYDNYTSGITVDDATGEASPSIWNNLIYDTGENMDYGIYLNSEMSETASPTIYHNTIDGGSLDGIFIEVAAEGSANPDIKYNIITNFDQYGINNSGGSPTIDYNDVWNNSSGNYNGCSEGINDISEDPLYASYELESTSPCIDQIPTGDPVDIDFAGYLRPRDGGYDIGAYEFVSDITHDYSLAGGSGDVTDYRIFTVPVNLETGSALKAQMEDALGTYDIGLWRVFAWDGTSSSYIEMDDPAFADLAVYPGMAFWVISAGSDPISFSGQPAPDGDYVEVPLTPGWNMFALPWPGTTIDLDNIAVSDGINNYWITSDNNSLTQKMVWDYTGTGPYNGYEQLTSGSALQPGKVRGIVSQGCEQIFNKYRYRGRAASSPWSGGR